MHLSVKKADSRKQMLYWREFLLTAAKICKNHQHVVTEHAGTDCEYQHCSCKGCPYDVKDFGETKLNGCILCTPDGWDRTERMKYIIRAAKRERRRWQCQKKSS